MIRRRTVLAATFTTLAAALLPGAARAGAPTQPVADFYNTLLDAMRHAQELKVKGRYAMLEPVMLKSFDVPAMTRLAIGNRFDALPPDDQARIRDAFGRLLVASFASDFDDFKGETFTIDDQLADYRGDKVVHTKFHPASGAAVDLNYLVRDNGSGTWRVIDVYLNGTISQLATWRSKFGGELTRGGPPAMLAAIKAQTDRDMAAI